MIAVQTESTLIPNREFTKLASDEQIERVAKALEANGMHALIAENGAEAKKMVLGLVPENAEIYTNQSKTLEKLGLFDEFDKSDRYNAVRPKVTRVPIEAVRMGREKMWVTHEKARRELGFRPAPAEVGLERAVEWFSGAAFGAVPASMA